LDRTVKTITVPALDPRTCEASRSALARLGGDGGKALRKSPGFYLRFDGVWAANGTRIDLPPMPIGQPTQTAGVTNSSFTGPSDGTKVARGRAVDRTIVKPTKAPHRRARRDCSSIRASGASSRARPQVRAMPMKKTKEMPDDVAFIMDEVLLAELQQTGFEAIGRMTSTPCSASRR